MLNIDGKKNPLTNAPACLVWISMFKSLNIKIFLPPYSSLCQTHWVQLRHCYLCPFPGTYRCITQGYMWNFIGRLEHEGSRYCFHKIVHHLLLILKWFLSFKILNFGWCGKYYNKTLVLCVLEENWCFIFLVFSLA